MEYNDLFLSREDALAIEQCLETFVENTGASGALLVRRDGSLIARSGTLSGIDLDTLCAIAAGAYASSESLAQLGGETAFNAIAHQGREHSLFVTTAGEADLLVIVYERVASNALVRLQAKVTAEAIVFTLDGSYARERHSRTHARPIPA